ncbi:hypothetical protein FisN_UnNu010 [Fistulifera solaris]|uniref:F-box domain-containing protein n=1 Tax=Fistulifera solaris TaxID=1519565 RepID=A0A1Z5J9W4_FISSO|nr:hypothetical protein FisN_UnNu010 [Fistulifera solaris]|eukprot:GAX10777.1 hypothetical protein FisN_UnNu010 [Fistulifera solaris]
MKRSIEDLSPTTTRENASLLSLHDDALMTVLLRTRASDHANLRRSCKRIRDMIDSFQFRKERGVQGFAEVDVDLLSGFEQYQLSKKSLGEHPPSEEDDSFYAQYDTLGYIYEYGDYSFETDCFRVFVDGRPLHKLRRREEFNLHVRLLPLCAPFWELCDCYNQTLCDLGTLLFTNKGKPKVASIKNALTCDDFCASHNLLYIQDFVLPFEYRFIESTVGPLLIKGVLKLFLDFYSITMYVPYRETQFTVEEADAERNTRFRFDEEKTDEDIQAEEERQIRNDRCKHQDMRQFFRAGFQQVNDQLVVEKSDYSYVFAIPEVTGEPILSLEETLKIPIARKTPTRPEPRGLAREFWLLVGKQICEWNVMTEELKDLRIPPLEKPLFAQMIDDFNGNVQQLKDQEDGLSNSIQERAQMDKDVSTLEESREIVRTSRRDLEEKINTLCTTLQSGFAEALNRKEAEMKTWQDKARKDLKTVLEKAENTLQLFYESDAIHVAAAGKNLDLLLMLLEFVPDSDRPMAVNALDRLGLTPLMVLATIAPSAGLTKCRQTMEAVINMGADTSIVHSINGLSALGHFRDSHEQEERHRILFGLPEPSVELKEEVVRIEALLRPADGPTAADEAILETRKDADSNDDESDY